MENAYRLCGYCAAIFYKKNLKKLCSSIHIIRTVTFLIKFINFFKVTFKIMLPFLAYHRGVGP